MDVTVIREQARTRGEVLSCEERAARIGRGRVRLLVTGLSLLVLSGCHGRTRVEERSLYARLSHLGRRNSGSRTDELAKRGAAAVVTQCGEASYSNVRKGLIVGETGLHEDVFEMRDRVSLKAVSYGMDETLEMEEMLRAETRVGGQPPDQVDCMERFAEHLESLTDPLLEADRLQKEVDLSAFTRAAKEAEDEKRREVEKLSTPY